MPTYHFCLRNSRAIEGREPSCEYPDLRAALVEAQGKARAVIQKRLRQPGKGELHGSFDIEDEQHNPVARIMLADLACQLS